MKRAGRWTTGLSLTFIGFVILVSQLTDVNGYEWIYKFWPFVLIGYGVEYLLASRLKERVRFDVAGALIVAIALVVVLGYGFFGVSEITGVAYTFEEVQSLVVDDAITSLYAETKNGKIQVEPVLEDKITVVATYRISVLDEDQAKHIRERYKLKTQVTNGQYRVEVEPSSTNWMNVGIDFTIFVPRDIAIDVKTTNGTVEIEGVDEILQVRTSNGSIIVRDSKGQRAVIKTTNGRVEVQHFTGKMDIDTTNGRVHVENFTGTLEIDTSNGGVEINRMTGGLRVETSNGKIFVKNGTPTDDWELETTNSSIEVELTQSGSYRYNFATRNGKINASNPPFVDASDRKDRVQGSINGGEIELDFSTTNGNITVHVREPMTSMINYK